VQYGRIGFEYTLEEWFKLALNYPGVKLLELSPQVAIESTRLFCDFLEKSLKISRDGYGC
jgi:PIN domain nuclease of toxin-antitoxin system